MGYNTSYFVIFRFKMILDYSDESCDIVVEKLKNDENAFVPTDTIFGIIASIKSQPAVENIFKLKKRDRNSKLQILCADFEMARNLIDINNLEMVKIFEKLALNFWPGALTIIVNKNPSVELFDSFVSDDVKIGIRVPNENIVLKIIRKLKSPICATSANISGEPHINSADLIDQKFHEENFAIIKSNRENLNIASTIVDISNPQKISFLRVGSIKEEEIMQLI